MLNKKDSEFNRKAFELGVNISSKVFGTILKFLKKLFKGIFLGFTGAGSMIVGMVVGVGGTKNEEETYGV